MDSIPSRSEPGSLNQDAAAASLTPHPGVYPGHDSPTAAAFVNRDLTVQPALLHQLASDVDLIEVNARPYYPPHHSNVPCTSSVAWNTYWSILLCIRCYQKVAIKSCFIVLLCKEIVLLMSEW